MRIMIVEDDAINRAILLKKLTKDFAHEVKQAVHGEEAVRLYEKDRDFDMVLMDLQWVSCAASFHCHIR
jgi:CheY-like chemotaxis protein